MDSLSKKILFECRNSKLAIILYRILAVPEPIDLVKTESEDIHYDEKSRQIDQFK